MGKLKDSRQFSFSNNKPVKTPSPEVIALGYDAVFSFLQSLLRGCESVYRMKVMLVGQENVGKTSLLRCLTEYVANGRKEPTAGIHGVDKTLINATGLTSMSTDGIDIGQLDFKVYL